MIAPAGTYDAAVSSIHGYLKSLGYTQHVGGVARRGQGAVVQNISLHAPITISGVSDPDRAATLARQQLEDFVRGAASGTRLHG